MPFIIGYIKNGPFWAMTSGIYHDVDSTPFFHGRIDELLNISDGEIDLSGVEFIDGIEFTFAPGLTSILPAGGRILMVKNLTTFELRYGSDPSRRIAGEFANDTNLRDSGEQIVIAGIDATPIRDFAYDDDSPWPESADGNSYSLILELPHTNPDHSLAQSRHSSAAARGAPGESGKESFAGDPLADTDGDGLNRLLEFATGTSDESPSEPGVSIDVEDGDSLTLSYQRNLAAAGIRYRVESSTDLITWTENTQLISETNLGDGTARVRHSLIAPLDSRHYLRLRVDLE